MEMGLSRFSLGTSKEQIVRMLTPSFDVRAPAVVSPGPLASGDSSVWIWSKNGPPYGLIGTIAFKHGRLVAASKDWGPNDAQDRGVPLGRSLYGAISALVRDGVRSCTLSTGQTESPGYENKVAFIRCENRTLQISVSRSDQFGESATVTEMLTK